VRTVGEGLVVLGIGVLFAEVCRRERRDGFLDTVWWSRVGWSRPDWERIQAREWGLAVLRFGMGFGWFIAAMGAVAIVLGLFG